MNQKKKIMIGTALVIILFCFLTNITSQAAINEGSFDITPYGEQFPIITSNKEIKTLSGDYQANGSLDCFLTDNVSHVGDYMLSGVIPDGVLWWHIGASGSFSINPPNGSAVFYFVLGNENGEDWVYVTFSIDFKGAGIPGFDFIYVLFTLLAILGVLYQKKKLNF